jgi:hypothetical protein
MLDVEWPDQLPQGFLRQQGLNNLRDSQAPQIPAQARQDARRYAEESVAAIKEQIFPLHGL